MTRTLTIILIITLAAASIGLFLASCQTYQPPGEGIWRAL
jgi:predicted small secreted protein